MQSINSAKDKITELSMAELDALAVVFRQGKCLIAFAGIPMMKPAPIGLSQILSSRAGGGTLGVLGGLTLRKSANAYTQPKFQTKLSHQKKQFGADHFAEVLPQPLAISRSIASMLVRVTISGREWSRLQGETGFSMCGESARRFRKQSAKAKKSTWPM